MEKMPENVVNALNVIADFVSDDYGRILQDAENEIVIYEITQGNEFVANCAMDSARAVVKDVCKQIICNMEL